MADKDAEKKEDSKEKKLLQAVKDRNVEQVKALLDEGANAAFEIYDPGVWGASHRESIIHSALRTDTLNLEIVKLLLEKGANINAVYEDYDWRGCGSKVRIYLH